MRRILAAFSLVTSLAACLAAFALSLAAQSQPAPETKSKTPAKSSAPSVAAEPTPPVVKDLPVRKVVLYKNGVGYFEHAGAVSGNQRVAIDFTSSQLNDVLQSLTVLDEGGGRIAGVNYNSTTPIEQQLRTLALGLQDYPATIAVYQALRGQRVEITGAGAPLAGKLVNIEFRKETDKNGQISDDHYFLIVDTDSGALRTAELTDSVSVRMADASLQKQFANYLDIVASAQNQQVRHLVLEDRGAGARQLRVSYISEIPVWKSTYRIVFPQTANGKATMQGWAVVDNTVGADWDNVQLSLVAGAPQSFIQPLSQPLYTRRPEIPIATEEQTTPQTHEAAEMRQYDRVEMDALGARVPAAPPPSAQSVTVVSGQDAEVPVDNSQITATLKNELVDGARLVDRAHGVGRGVDGNVGGGMLRDTFGTGTGSGSGFGSGVYRTSDAISEGDVSTNAFDDFFEYALAQPVTIRKNESAMVPILQQELPAEHVTLWSQEENRALRAVWLENTSKLTLDSGSFSIFESGEFAGEGLLDPIHPGEKRLLSYAADQAVRMNISAHDSDRTLHHVKIGHGVIQETHMDVASTTYSPTNSADEDRVVVLEHMRRQSGWTLDEGLKAAETTPSLYRFRIPVHAHSTEKLEVREHGPEFNQVWLNANTDQTGYLLDLVKRAPDSGTTLKPVIDAQSAIADLDRRIRDSKQAEQTAAADEARDRDNLTALRNNDAAKRFVDELNHAEDQLQAARKQTADLEMQKQAAVDKLNALISTLSFDWDVTAK